MLSLCSRCRIGLGTETGANVICSNQTEWQRLIFGAKKKVVFFPTLWCLPLTAAACTQQARCLKLSLAAFHKKGFGNFNVQQVREDVFMQTGDHVKFKETQRTFLKAEACTVFLQSMTTTPCPAHHQHPVWECLCLAQVMKIPDQLVWRYKMMMIAAFLLQVSNFNADRKSCILSNWYHANPSATVKCHAIPDSICVWLKISAFRSCVWYVT